MKIALVIEKFAPAGGVEKAEGEEDVLDGAALVASTGGGVPELVLGDPAGEDGEAADARAAAEEAGEAAEDVGVERIAHRSRSPSR